MLFFLHITSFWGQTGKIFPDFVMKGSDIEGESDIGGVLSSEVWWHKLSEGEKFGIAPGKAIDDRRTSNDLAGSNLGIHFYCSASDYRFLRLQNSYSIEY